MRQVVVDVIDYLKTGTSGPTLRVASERFGAPDLRFFCIQLAGWWGRGTLMVSRHPYIPMGERHPWHARFREFVAAVPELSELVQFDDRGCHFAPGVPREEWQAINEYVRANYKPTLHVSFR